ncbi:3-hydroxybutyrate dehydrogenase [Thalassomonas viridans]|uniref:3-hydroxybutyrate dehydrogenase n=1 Tax=Thalassomonas viridans TaxID=137584 RepID=A0AAE9YZA6_9GAMM|nr:3-hydroxybutyrate dehydrogenase [Thalassomonas viridans]WDE03745.1 3-hydroxybutyrate dehydrogenase [Thalassomonas viridans]
MDKRVAVVTGGASGIGFAAAKALSEANHTVVIADLSKEQGITAAEQLDCDFVQADLSSAKDNYRLIESTAESHGSVDVLVNNAGFQHVCQLASFPEDTWEKMLAVMLTSPFLLTKYAWPYMKKNGWGRVINIASVHGMIASPYKSAYISAKHGLLGLTRTAALEGGEFGITVNAICPAYVKTPLVDKQILAQALNNNMSPDDVISEVMLKNAAIKKLIEPEEVGAFVAYLASDIARSFTGASLALDLGWTAQ